MPVLHISGAMLSEWIFKAEVQRIQADKVKVFNCVNCGKDTMASKLLTMNELIKDKLSGANSNDCGEAIPSSFKDAVDSVENQRIYFFSQKNSEIAFNELDPIHNDDLNNLQTISTPDDG
uniref:Uncharacterized protein n=1 Tax=Araneus ventricosus TaxID=182803 RepID=A0A4Y2T0X7_ARAVE|nr:hypothetical protein AVEN_113915-1 [Araneus ventricosus]